MERQTHLAGLVRQAPLPAPIRYVAGVDAAFPDGGRTTRAAAVLMSFPALELAEEVVFEQPTELPYIPGLLSFRELPAMLGALWRLGRRPDVVLCDGHGRAHPRRFGIACFLGVRSGLPVIGVGKSRLCGQHPEVGLAKGDHVLLQDGEEALGQVLRSRSGVRPIYVSVGHGVELDEARRLVLACTTRYRLPEPQRRADRLAGARSGK